MTSPFLWVSFFYFYSFLRITPPKGSLFMIFSKAMPAELQKIILTKEQNFIIHGAY